MLAHLPGFQGEGEKAGRCCSVGYPYSSRSRSTPKAFLLQHELCHELLDVLQHAWVEVEKLLFPTVSKKQQGDK